MKRALCLCSVLLAACATSTDVPPDGAGDAAVAGPLSPTFIPLGEVPFDGHTLPLLAPNGERIVSAAGETPSWGAVLAQPGASAPKSTLTIFEISPGASPIAVARLPEGVLLGRSSDRAGFLVESINGDGSRWIGHASWRDGAIDWLVADGKVNAFAALGPNGELAWCRRAVDGERFELVVRRGRAATGHSDAEQLVLTAEENESWLLPTFARGGGGLFAFSLALPARKLDGDDSGAEPEVAALQARLHPSPLRLGAIRIESTALSPTGPCLTLAEHGSPMTAFQALAAQGGEPAPMAQPADALLFFHPRQQCVCAWHLIDARLRTFPANSLAAIHLGPEVAPRLLVASKRSLELSRAGGAGERLLAGLHLPRATMSESFDAILLDPRAGQVGITALTLTR